MKDKKITWDYLRKKVKKLSQQYKIPIYTEGGGYGGSIYYKICLPETDSILVRFKTCYLKNTKEKDIEDVLNRVETYLTLLNQHITNKQEVKEEQEKDKEDFDIII